MPLFQKALEVDPGREAARIDLASCQARTGRAAEAVANYQKALKGEMMEHDPQARDRKAAEAQDGPAPRGPRREVGNP